MRVSCSHVQLDLDLSEYAAGIIEQGKREEGGLTGVGQRIVLALGAEWESRCVRCFDFVAGERGGEAPPRITFRFARVATLVRHPRLVSLRHGKLLRGQ